MTFFMKIQTLTLVLLLLGATCIAPVMAGSPKYITEDGVHLTKYADSPTQLDPNYYRLNSADDVVVDGDQYYWVRVGNVKAEGLTSAWWSQLAAFVLLLVTFISFFVMWCWVFPRVFPKTFAQMPQPIGDFGPKGERWSRVKRQLPFVFPLLCSIAIVYCVYSSGALSSVITHVACDGYVDLQASDGTLLLTVDKIHPETNTLYMKSGLNLTTLIHLPASGNCIPAHGVSPP